MERIYRKYLLEEARDKANRFQNYHNYLQLDYERNQRRIKNPPPKEVKIPEEWNDNKKHNPFYVLKRIDQISKSISKKILNGTYSPFTPYQKEIPKASGGTRKISVYQIPDSAVSDLFYHNLLSKNKHRFSSLSYAYRNDRNVHFAIQDISHELTSVPRIFIAEFDFTKFFDSINHDYLFEQLNRNAFLVSDLDKKIINAFLSTSGEGIPQGTSISLFLANLACWKLDRRLEDEGIRFARYADDTIIWSKQYSKVSTAFDIISEFSKETGIKINYKKSEGISLLQKKELQSEFHNPKEYVEFLGYKISSDNVGIKKESVKNIKRQVSYLLYRNLIQPIQVKPLSNVSIPSNDFDRDFITAIMQVRRYLFGNLTEMTLKKYLNGTYSWLEFKGIMSFYPLVDHEQQMVELDRWLLSTILNVLAKRERLFTQHLGSFNSNQFPFNCNKEELLSECRNKVVFEKKGLIQIPSFLRIHKALRKGVLAFGIERVMHPKSYRYYN